jgi:hypothetical protein
MKLMIPFRGHSYVRHRNRFAGKIREARRPVALTAMVFTVSHDRPNSRATAATVARSIISRRQM